MHNPSCVGSSVAHRCAQGPAEKTEAGVGVGSFLCSGLCWCFSHCLLTLLRGSQGAKPTNSWPDTLRESGFWEPFKGAPVKPASPGQLRAPAPMDTLQPRHLFFVPPIHLPSQHSLFPCHFSSLWGDRNVKWGPALYGLPELGHGKVSQASDCSPVLQNCGGHSRKNQGHC